MDFRTRGNFSKRRMQNFAFKLDRDTIIKILIYILISGLLLITLSFLNVYFSYKARIVDSVEAIPEEITSVVVLIDELNLDKTEEITFIVDDLERMKSENKIDNFKFFIQKREDTFPNITNIKDKFKEILGDEDFEITTKSTRTLCGEILESGINKTLIISPQSETIFNTYSCNLSNMYAIGYYPKIKSINFFNGFTNKFYEVISISRE